MYDAHLKYSSISRIGRVDLIFAMYFYTHNSWSTYLERIFRQRPLRVRSVSVCPQNCQNLLSQINCFKIKHVFSILCLNKFSPPFPRILLPKNRPHNYKNTPKTQNNTKQASPTPPKHMAPQKPSCESHSVALWSCSNACFGWLPSEKDLVRERNFKTIYLRKIVCTNLKETHLRKHKIELKFRNMANIICGILFWLWTPCQWHQRSWVNFPASPTRSPRSSCAANWSQGSTHLAALGSGGSWWTKNMDSGMLFAGVSGNSRDSREYKPQISLPCPSRGILNFPSRSREKEILARN